MFGGTMSDGEDGGSGRERKKKAPSGQTQPVRPFDPSHSEDSQPSITIPPMPVVLTATTILKLASVILVPIIGIISAGIYFYHRTNSHIDDTAIHLSKDERPKLETKVEANKSRDKMEKAIKRELNVSIRELKQDVITSQKAQFKKMSAELSQEQKAWGDRLLREVKEARKDIKAQ